MKTGEVVASERETAPGASGVLLLLQKWAFWLTVLTLLLWTGVTFFLPGNVEFFPTLWKVVRSNDDAGGLIRKGLLLFPFFVVLARVNAARDKARGRLTVRLQVRFFGTQDTTDIVLREPSGGAWPKGFSDEVQKSGTLIAWKGKRCEQAAILLCPLYTDKRLRIGLTEEGAAPFFSELTGDPDSPYGDAARNHEALQEQKRRLEAQRQQEAAEAQRRAELARQLAIQAEQRRKEMERQELQKVVAQTYAFNWSYPPAGLLIGTVHVHPLEDRRAKQPDYLRPEFERHVYDLPIWFTGDEMGLTFGTTGSGKLTAAIAPNVLLYDGSCFVIDPKGEVCAVTAAARKSLRKQEVLRLDPFDITEFAPGVEKTPLANYNPLDALDPTVLSFADDAKSLASVLVEVPAGAGDPFWTNEAADLLTALIMFVCTHPDAEGDRTLSRVHGYLSPELGQQKWLLDTMCRSSHDTIRLCGNAHSGMPDKQREGVWSAARQQVSLFGLPVMKAVTSSSDFRFEDLLEGGCTVYLVLDAERLESHNRWLRLIMTVSLMMAVRHKGRGKRMLWIVDEAAQLGRNDIIPKAYRLLRGYNVRMWTFWQDLGSLKKAFPDDWSSLVANSFVQVLSAGDFDSAKYFSDLAGEHKAENISLGETTGTSYTDGLSASTGFSSNSGSSFGPGGATFSSSGGGSGSSGWSKSTTNSFSRNTNRSWQWELRMRPIDISSMPEERMYVRFPRQKAVFLDKFHYFSSKQLNALACPNPFFKQRTPSQAQRREKLQQTLGQLLNFPTAGSNLLQLSGSQRIESLPKFQRLPDE